MPNKPPAAAASGVRPVGIFVLGMHRSGTSVLTRILNLLGCSLPTDLLGANASNPSGHWESSRAIEINDSLLAALGRRWDDVRELPGDWMQRPETEAARQQIRALIDWEFSGKRLWLLKEPRMCRLAPLWLEVAQEMGIDTRVILPIRHPSEVSYSLTRRDGIAAGRTQLLWCRYVLEAEHASRAVPRVLVDFGALTADWHGQVERIATALGLEWPNQSSEVVSQIDAFIDPDLRHADASGRREQLTERVPLAAPIARLYKEMLKAEGDEVWEVIARASDSIARNGSLFAPVIDDLAEQVERKQARAAAMNAILADKLTDGGAWLLNESEIQTLLGETRAILDRVDENGPVTVELIRQIETQRQEIRANASLISEGNSQLFQKIEQTGPLLAEIASQVEAQRREASVRQDSLLVELAGQIEVQRSELDDVGKLIAAEGHGIRERIEQAHPLMVELIRQVQDQGVAIDAMRRSFAAQQRASLSSEMHEQDRIVYAETEAALRLQLELSQAQIDARQQELEFLRSQLQYLGREHSRQLSEQAARIDELLNSRSWKLTAPFRWVSRRFRSGPRVEARAAPAPQASPDKDGLLRSIYLALPLSWSTRLRIKSAAFKLLGPMIGNTDAYRRWQSQQRPPPQLLEAEQPPRRAPDEAGERVGLRSAYTEPKYVPIAPDSVAMDELRAKLIAFYLPQFHPIPENDEWWGRGFTEWTNVSKAVPQFKGHGVPHLPGELGFYDLRLPEVMQRQIELARQYGVHGFCFHYYWFDGRRILERPLDQFLGNPEFDFPFCICWANENWTRRWDGHDDDVLLGQSHSPESDLRFIRDADRILRDPRYIRVDGRPLLIVYRPSLLPDCAGTVARWREYCREAGIGEIMLAMVQFDVEDPRPFGFDVALEFPPHKLARNLPSINATLESLNPEFRGYVVDYQAVVNRSVNWPVPEYDMIRGVFPGWDNEARKPQQGYLFANSSPERYRDWLQHAVDYARGHRVHGEALVFVNAWNEWAEGAYLEPDRRYGYAYLQATRDALTARPRDGGDEDVRVTSADRPRSLPAPASDRRVVVVSHDAHPHGAQYLSLHLCREISRVLGCQVDVVLLGDGVLEADFQQAATVHSLPCRGGTAAGLELARKLRAGGADVAIANTTVSGLFASDLSAAGFKLVSLVHEMPGVIESYGLRPHAQRIARDADLVVFAADAVREGFEQFATLDPARTLIRTQGNYKHNRHQSAASIAGARRELRRRLGIGEDALVVLSVGYADLRKGVDLFVSVGAKLIRQDPRVHMLWLGHLDLGLEPELRAQIRATGLERHFHFPGRDSDTDVYYAGSDLYALTSREDPFPTVIMEAFDVGVPVVGFTSAGGFEELLGRAGGRLAPAFDVDAYALECSKLLADDALRLALGREGKAVVESEFSFTDYVHDLLGYLGVQVPRVSVVVPNYNYARYLPERLRSIAGQTLPPYEIIVLDDASSDDSLAVLGELAGSIPLRVIVNEENSGSVFRQWQKGVAAARGDYVWIAEADDLSAPEFLRTVMAAFQLPGVVMSYCQSRQIDEHGKELSPDYLDYVADFGAERWREPFRAALAEELDNGLAVKNTIPNVSAVVFRREELAEALTRNFEEISGFRIAGDWLTYLHVLGTGSLAFHPAALNLHRRHAGGVTIGADHQPHFNEVLSVQRWVAGRFPLTDKTVDAAARYMKFLEVHFGLGEART